MRLKQGIIVKLETPMLQISLAQQLANCGCRKIKINKFQLTLTPFVDQQRWWFRVAWLDPRREQPALVCLVPKVLIEIGVGDLFQRLDIVHRNQVTVEIHELDSSLLEGALGQQMSLDSRQRLVRVVVCLLDQSQFFALALVQTRLHAVSFFQAFQGENQQLRVVLVGKRRKGNRSESSRFQPMHSCRVNGHSFLGRDVRTILQIVVLSLLFSLQIQASQSSKILLANCFVDGCATTNSLAIVVSGVRPPIRLHLDVTKNHVLDRDGQAWHLPWNVGLPASPCLRQMLKNRSGLVLLDAFWHHVNDVVHNRGSQLEIEVRLDALLGDSLGDTFAVATLELTRQKVSKPALQQRSDSAHEEQPDSPSRRPEAATGSFADRSRVEAVVNQMLQVLAHSNLLHQLVLVAVHTSQLSNVSEDVLKTVGQLEGIDIVQSILDV